MTHKFDSSRREVYAATAKQIDQNVFSSGKGVDAGGAEQLYDVLTNAIVAALGDIAAQAFRHGVNDPRQLKGLARAVARVSEQVITSYQGEVDPEAALRAIESDPRLASLPDVDRQQLSREIDKTRRLEHLLLEARRIPDLIDLAGSLDLHIPDEVIDEGTVLLSRHPTPTAGTT